MAYYNGNVVSFNPIVNSVKLDEAMSDTSINGVQNKVIKAYVDNATPTQEHGTWTPTFESDFISSLNTCNCTYTILNEHEAYISMYIEGTAGNSPTSAAANLFTGFPVPIQESAGISMLPVGDVSGVEFTDYKNPCIFVVSGNSMAQIGLTPNESFVIAVNGVITYA